MQEVTVYLLLLLLLLFFFREGRILIRCSLRMGREELVSVQRTLN